MIPIALVTGFLGCGKTTFLQRLVDRWPQRKLVYLVNEFSPVDVDGALLDLPPGRLISVSGGSIFCRCLVTEFIDRLQEISELGTSIEGVAIEASGIANPKVIQKMLQETALDKKFSLSSIIAITDPQSLLDLVDILPNIVAQLEAADLAIVNKSDLADEEEIAETQATIRKHNPSAKILTTSFCNADIDPFSEQVERDLIGDYAKCADPNFAVFEVTIDAPVDLDAILNGIRESMGVIYRVKGFVETKTETVYVDVSKAGVSVTPKPSAQTKSLVVIAHGKQYPRLMPFLNDLRGGKFSV